MKTFFLSLYFIAACGTDPSAWNDDVGEQTGEDVYREACANCHGGIGEGSVDGPQIQFPVAGYARYVVRTGRADLDYYEGPMPTFAADEIGNSDLDAVLGFLGNGPRPTTGVALYTTFCGNCHGADAQGGRVEESVASPEADEVEEKVREGHGGTSYASRKKYMPSWSERELSGVEVEAIASYLATLEGGDDDDDDDDDDD